ncbi:LPS export ABC transporter periplasmic protein LptC [Sunxiuqinia sp. A32]|uniref:LPS export ABC transporter periplasmic protein LptC n=1 Tax=Sunxiuqinia sp. A32 TaxID=3461496 RepID=UPI0040458F16
MQRSNTSQKRYLSSSIAILIMGIAVLFFSCSNDIETIKAYATDEKRPAVTAFDFEMLYSDSTVIRYKLKTPELIRFEEEKDPFTEFPKGVYIEKFDEKMQIVSNISADYARLYDKEQRWEAKNNVIAVNAENDTLKTEQLTWEEEKGKIYSEQFVKIIRKDQIITGVGFESDQNLANWKIKDPKGTLYIDVEE